MPVGQRERGPCAVAYPQIVVALSETAASWREKELDVAAFTALRPRLLAGRLHSLCISVPVTHCLGYYEPGSEVESCHAFSPRLLRVTVVLLKRFVLPGPGLQEVIHSGQIRQITDSHFMM